MHRRDILIAPAALAFAAAARAQLGNAPVRILVGAPAGGSTDTLARSIAVSMGPALGRTVIVENKPGAGGNIAADAVAKAAPDGNTLLMSFTSHAINATLYPSLPFDPVKDFTALAKARPGQLNFAIGAVGSSLHMAGEAFKMQSGVDIVNIPYKGTAPAVQDLLAGQVQLMFAAVGNIKAHIQAGKLRALGVTTAKRLPAFPDVPAIAEALPGYESSAWFGLFGPARLPADVSRKLSDAARHALQQPDMLKRLDTEGAIPVGNSPEQFTAFVQSEIPRWAKVVKFSGAKPE
ncbi:tripartite tricarboxylate transporter substrate binding protein [Variovorax guangxiensis]|uniref:Tripartite tricarboxylate transporter substrate binding protein n=1 Tax=Variovorax guangxiensis TaxID=1775474 RepID=A0A433MIG8_9BURK|nr:tripartite tricarboxylate transporter substrate binding protein [Variovorax guangxiensis]RUR67390.1 tripartite tricarboxylate transporter substrate binding protein [Variovorax guangxiensis]